MTPGTPDAGQILDLMRAMQAACMPASVTVDHVAKQIRILPNIEPQQSLKDEVVSLRVSGGYGVTWEKPHSPVEMP